MRVEGGEITDTYEQLFTVNQEVPAHVQVLTRIRPEALEGKPLFEEKQAEITEKLSGVEMLVGQNLAFDIGMLKGEGIDVSDRPWVDTSLLAALVFPEMPSYSLGFLSTDLNLNHEPVHRALGDVRATLELFGKIWERLLELSPEQLAFAKEVMGRSTPGYTMLFDALPEAKSAGASWIIKRERAKVTPKKGTLNVSPPPVGTVELHEEGLHPDSLQEIVNAAVADDSATHWIAVKNLEHALRKLHLPNGVSVLNPPQLLLNMDAVKDLHVQETLSAEEALLLLKIEWFNPTTRFEVAVHGGEKDVWFGKLACTDQSNAYTDQFAQDASVFLLDHRQLLSFVADAEHSPIADDAHVIVDDASMLEDTATKAYGHYVSVDGLRAAASGDQELARFCDLLALWIEKTRAGEDMHYLIPSEHHTQESKGLREVADQLLHREDLPPKTIEQMKAVRALLDERLLATHLVWIEARYDGTLTMTSAPEHVEKLLQQRLYNRHPTTLLVPPGAETSLPAIVAADAPSQHKSADGFTPCTLPVSFLPEDNLHAFLQDPPAGKTIVLAPSKRVIEQAYVAHVERLEANGITLICQGLNGGQGRMEAEFIAATGPAILVVTPFMYEGMDFPRGTANLLALEQVPFDHPNHAVVSKRKNHFRNGFMDYLLPRAEFRVFRLMRTFCRHRTDDAQMKVFDRRLFEKEYGKHVQEYITQCSGVESASEAQSSTPKKPKTSKGNDAQLQMPL